MERDIPRWLGGGQRLLRVRGCPEQLRSRHDPCVRLLQISATQQVLLVQRAPHGQRLLLPVQPLALAAHVLLQRGVVLLEPRRGRAELLCVRLQRHHLPRQLHIPPPSPPASRQSPPALYCALSAPAHAPEHSQLRFPCRGVPRHLCDLDLELLVLILFLIKFL